MKLTELNKLCRLMDKFNLIELQMEGITLKKRELKNQIEPILKPFIKELTSKEILDKHQAEKIIKPISAIIDDDPNFELFNMGINPFIKE